MRIFIENEIEDTYGLLTGERIEPASKIPSLVESLKKNVKNVFEVDESCALIDQNIFELRKKIADRLNTNIDIDKDLIELASLYENFQKELCMKTFIISRLLLRDEITSDSDKFRKKV